MKKLAIAFVAMLSALTMLVSPASAQGSAPTTSDVTVLHGIPGVDVDVYAGGNLLLPNFKPKQIAGPLQLAPAAYPIQIFAHVSDPPATAAARTDSAVITQTVTVPAAGLNISLIANLDATGTPVLTPFVNDLSTLSNPTTARLSIRHTAEAPAVDIVAGGEPVAGFTNIANGSEKTGVLPAGTYPTGIAAAGTTTVLFPAPVTLKPGQLVAVYAIGSLASSPASFDLLVQSFGGLGLNAAYRGLSGNDASIARIYLALLGRSPDADGFAYWKTQTGKGLGLLALISNFEVSKEFTTRFPTATTDQAWLDLAYQNVLGRTPDSAGNAYWLGLLNSGKLDRHEMLLYFADSAEFKAYTATS